MQTRIATTERLDIVDALRGFAVMAILLVHNLEHFIYPVYPELSSQPCWLNVLDKKVFSLTFGLFAGKSYSIFALLFGFTFFVQYTNQFNKGKDFGYRFLWRLLLLTGFATLNSALFPGGDVLLLYAVTGLILFVVRKWSDKAVLILAVILLLQPIEWYHYFRSLGDPQYKLPDLGVERYYIEVINTTKTGTLWEQVKANISKGQLASFMWAVGTGRLLQTAGLFMLGMLIGRCGLFRNSDENRAFWTRTLIASAILFNPLYLLRVQVYEQGSTEIIRQTAGVAFDMWQKFAFTFVLVSSFMLLWPYERFRAMTTHLRSYGRMSLTNYITQGIVGAFIYFPIGLHLAPVAGYTLSLFIGILMFIAQLAFCNWWLSGFKQGPLESLWHRMTWL